jgi:hypothetical protein
MINAIFRKTDIYDFKNLLAIRFAFCLFKSKIENKRLLPINKESNNFFDTSCFNEIKCSIRSPLDFF